MRARLTAKKIAILRDFIETRERLAGAPSWLIWVEWWAERAMRWGHRWYRQWALVRFVAAISVIVPIGWTLWTYLETLQEREQADHITALTLVSSTVPKSHVTVRKALALLLREDISLRRVQWSGAELEHSDLHDADLFGAQLSGASLRFANLSGANLATADLRGADLWDADISKATLAGADLRKSSLILADLRDTSFYSPNHSGVDLRGAKLRAADLRGANLRDAKLSGADLTKAKVSQRQLDTTCVSDEWIPPILDEGLKPPTRHCAKVIKLDYSRRVFSDQ